MLAIEFWIDFFFSVITLKMLFYSLLTFIVSNEKSVNNWIVVLLYKIYHFLFLLSKFAHYTWLLILTLAPDFWVWLWCLAILLDVHRVGWICKFMYFIKFGKCLVITSSNSSCLFFFLSSFLTKVHLEAGTWVGSQSSYFFLFFCKLFWFSLALFILFLFFSWQIFFAKVFYYTRSALFFKMLDCLQTEMLKMKFHFKNTFLFFPATMMSL